MSKIEKIEEEKRKILSDTMAEIIMIFYDREITVGEASGIIGAIFAYLSTRTEDNFPFISFMNSFTRSYHVNFTGEDLHNVSDPLSIFNNLKEKAKEK